MPKYDELTDYMIINSKTGELGHNLTIKEKKYLDERFTSANPFNDSGNKYIPSDNIFNTLIKEVCGSFYFGFYENIIQYEGAYLFRFLYLSTFSNYKGYLQYGNSKNKNKLVLKKDIMEILNLKKTETYDTIKYLEGENLIMCDENNYIMVNTDISKRGNLGNNKYDKEYTRMFDDGIRNLYIKSTPKEHKTIGNMFKLLPYVHESTNIICSNPKEDDIESIKPLKLKEILGIINTSKATIKTIMNLKIMNNTESAFLKTSNAFVKNFYIINPRITYKGLSSAKIDKDTDKERYTIEEFLCCFRVGSKRE